MRNNFQPVFEETETAIKDRMINKVLADNWRAEQGDFMYDAVVPSATEIKDLQRNQDTVLASRFAKYAEGAALDDCLYDIGLTRLAASANRRALTITADAGVVIPAGQLFYAVVLDGQGQPLQFTADAAVTWASTGALGVNLTCKTLGSIGNLATGSQFVIQPPIPGVRIITDTGSTVIARDVETDEEAWGRYDFKVTNPDTGGNKNDLVRWAQEVTGVGKAKCIPRWNGVNTSKVLLVGNDFKAASTQVVSDAQVYMDPAVGGLGNGRVPMGNACTVVAATNITVNIVVNGLTYSGGAIPANVKAAFIASITDYLKSLVFAVDGSGNALPVVYNRVVGLLTFTTGVSNFTSVTLNATSADVAVSSVQVPILGTLTGMG